MKQLKLPCHAVKKLSSIIIQFESYKITNEVAADKPLNLVKDKIDV